MKRNKLINIKDVPVIEFENSVGLNPNNNHKMQKHFKSNALKVYAFGLPAHLLIIQRSFSSEKVILLFDSPWPKMLITKYFYFKNDGMMKWGHDGGEIKLTYRN